jgi:hypothetical protein
MSGIRKPYFTISVAGQRPIVVNVDMPLSDGQTTARIARYLPPAKNEIHRIDDRVP